MILLFAISMPAMAEREIIDYDDLKHCINKSYYIEDFDAKMDKKDDALNRMQSVMSQIDSELLGLDWDYNNAMHRLDMCRIQNPRSDHPCMGYINQVNNLGSQYNNLVDEYNSSVSRLDRVYNDYNNRCADKSFLTKDSDKACKGHEDTIFCKEVKER